MLRCSRQRHRRRAGGRPAPTSAPLPSPGGLRRPVITIPSPAPELIVTGMRHSRTAERFPRGSVAVMSSSTTLLSAITQTKMITDG